MNMDDNNNHNKNNSSSSSNGSNDRSSSEKIICTTSGGAKKSDLQNKKSDFDQFLVEEYTREKMINPSLSLEKVYPMIKRRYTSKRMSGYNSCVLSLHMLANRKKTLCRKSKSQ